MSTSPIILDPLTYLNASKSSFRINEVKEAFSRALDFLNNYKIRYDKIDVEFKEGSNILYDLMFNC